MLKFAADKTFGESFPGKSFDQTGRADLPSKCLSGVGIKNEFGFEIPPSTSRTRPTLT
jgi:hypothetical protein